VQVSCIRGARHLAKGKQKITNRSVPKKKNKMGVTRNRSIVKGVADSNCAPLDRPERPYRDCRGRVKRALWQDAETDAGAVASGALFIQFARRFIL